MPSTPERGSPLIPHVTNPDRDWRRAFSRCEELVPIVTASVDGSRFLVGRRPHGAGFWRIHLTDELLDAVTLALAPAAES